MTDMVVVVPPWVAGTCFGGRSSTAFETRLRSAEFLFVGWDVACVDDGRCVWIHYSRDGEAHGRYWRRRRLEGGERTEESWMMMM